MVLRSFSLANGVPPNSGSASLAGALNPINNDAAKAYPGVVGKRDIFAASPSNGVTDYALDGAICHRNLVEGEDIVSGKPFCGTDAVVARWIQEGIEEVRSPVSAARQAGDHCARTVG